MITALRQRFVTARHLRDQLRAARGTNVCETEVCDAGILQSDHRYLTVTEGLAEIGADVISGGNAVSGQRQCSQMSRASRSSSMMAGLVFIVVKERGLLISTLLNVYHLEEEV